MLKNVVEITMYSDYSIKMTIKLTEASGLISDNIVSSFETGKLSKNLFKGFTNVFQCLFNHASVAHL